MAHEGVRRAYGEQHRRRVLLTEDEFLIRALIADELRFAGWDVIEAASGDDAMEIIGWRCDFDVLLTDVHLPGQTSGLDLARAMRRESPRVKIALMSAHWSPGQAEPRLFDVFIPKPVRRIVRDLEELVTTRAEMHR